MIANSMNRGSKLTMLKATAAYQRRTMLGVSGATTTARCCNNKNGDISSSSSRTSSSATLLFSSIAYHQNATTAALVPQSSSWMMPRTAAVDYDIASTMAETAQPQTINSDSTSGNNNSTDIRTIQEFIAEIPEAVNQRKIDTIEPGADNDPVAQLFRRSELPKDAWMKYALFDASKPYTRNLIATDHKTYTLLLLCWNPAQESPIHDHPCDGCWLQVVQGGIREVRYNTELKCIADRTYHADNDDSKLSYITDNLGYHKVGNIDTKDQMAVTLHLYSPPFDTCQCWSSCTTNENATNDTTNANNLVPYEGKSINYSEYGRIV